MPRRKTTKTQTLAQDSKGRYLKNIGGVRNPKSGKISQRKFYLGHDEDMARHAAARLEALWKCVERRFERLHSSSGRVLFEGEREAVVRPRVRKRTGDSSSEEVVLVTYEAARDPSQLQDSIVTALMHGVSTRGVERIKPNSPGVGKSNVSRHRKSVGHKFVDELRGRDLSKENWAVVMLDGIRLSEDQLAVVAIGISTKGRKHVLDFELGSSEVAKDLMRRLMKRGFHCDRPLLAVLDGSDALRLAVKEFFPDAIVQRCLVHKERNIRSKLSKKH